MGLPELWAGSPQGFSDLRWAYNSCRRKMGLQELRAGSPFRPKLGLQELRAGSLQGFSDPRWAYKSCGLAARRGFQT